MKHLMICQNGVSDYRIVIDLRREHSQRAAAILQNAVFRSTGASLPIVSDTEPLRDREIVVGKTNRDPISGYDRCGMREIGFAMLTVGERLFLDGGSFYGAIFAVYAFLRRFLHWEPYHPWSAPDALECLQVPSDLCEQNSPALWTKQIPAAGDGAQIYMIPTSLMPNGAASFRGMGFVIRTAGGKLLVIDGGHAADAPVILETLRVISGQEVPEVDGWFLTHIHADHVDAFLKIGEDLSDRVRVNCFYHHLPSKAYAERWGETDRYARLMQLKDTFCLYHEVQIGDVMQFDGVGVEIVFAVSDDFENYLNRRIEASQVSIGKPCGDAINNSDTLYKFTAEGRSALFIGDFMHFGEDYFYQNYPHLVPKLKADMIQVGHHGSNFISRRFYADVGAHTALWSNTLDCWYFSDHLLANTRARLYELQLVKNYIAGDGIFPIPFRDTDITEKECSCYRTELRRLTFSQGQTDSPLLSHRYGYTLCLEGKTRVTVCAEPFFADAEVRLQCNGQGTGKSLPCELLLTHGDRLDLTVTERDGACRTYTVNVCPVPKICEVLHLDLRHPEADGTVRDRSGNGNDAHPTKGGMIIADAALPADFSPFTVSVWVKPEKAEQNGTVCYFGDEDEGGNSRWILRMHNSRPEAGCPRFRNVSAYNRMDYTLFSSIPLRAGEWNLIQLVNDSPNQLLYINGVFSCERSFGIYMKQDGKNRLFLGTSPRGVLPFAGEIGEVRIFNHALSRDAVAKQYETEKGAYLHE